jgi:hypothetical protein
MRKPFVPLALAVAATLALTPPATAGSVEKTVPFELDQWIDLASTDGPVTLHRIRLARKSGVSKSMFARPGNDEYLQDVQIQLEFSNEATKDWEAHLVIEWVDGDGRAIDGYNDTEGLDSESKQDDTTVTLSTLKYGLDRAKKLKIKIDFYKD